MIPIEKCCIFTFFTTTGVMDIEKQCKLQGIPGRIVSVPRSITSDCGLAFKTSLEYKDKVLSLCENVDFDSLYFIDY